MKEVHNLIEDFLFHCKYEKNLSPLTLKAYSIDLNQFLVFLKTKNIENIQQVDKYILRDYLKKLFESGKPKTVKRKIASVKALFTHLEFEDIILINPFHKMKLGIKEGKQLPKTIELKKIKKLFSYLYEKKEKTNITNNYSYKALTRDIAVLELLFASGMRVSELATLKLNNINFSKGFVIIRGKGNRERIIPIPHNDIINALKNYYELFKDEINKNKHFFINRFSSRLSEQSIRLMIRKYTKAINLQQHITPHMFRHSVATLLLENGVDIRYIQNILGHSTINTTQIYVQVNEAPKRKILKLKHPRRSFDLR